MNGQYEPVSFAQEDKGDRACDPFVPTGSGDCMLCNPTSETVNTAPCTYYISGLVFEAPVDFDL